jgi:hypothetical protein
MFNYGNVRIPARLEGVLLWLLVTPEMHRVHHSAVVAETNSNFGFNLSCGDRLLGTYRQNPASGHEAMTIGIDQFCDQRELWLPPGCCRSPSAVRRTVRDHLKTRGTNSTSSADTPLRIRSQSYRSKYLDAGLEQDNLAYGVIPSSNATPAHVIPTRVAAGAPNGSRIRCSGKSTPSSCQPNARIEKAAGPHLYK